MKIDKIIFNQWRTVAVSQHNKIMIRTARKIRTAADAGYYWIPGFIGLMCY